MRSFLRHFPPAVLTVFTVISLSFFLIYLIPGDPVDFILKERGAPEDRERLREALHLNKTLPERYKDFLKNLLHLNLGESLVTGEAVFETLKEQTAFTLPLAGLAFFLSLVCGVSFGVFSVRISSSALRSTRLQKAARTFFDILPVLLFSFPAFALAPLLTAFFSLRLQWLPVSGAGGFSYLILPALSLALPLGAVLMKITRTSLEEAKYLDCVRTAQSKGLSPSRVYYRHVFPNALIPIVTIAGLQLGALLTGTVIIETLFDRPGIGSLLYRAIVNRDYPLIQGAVLWIALLYVLINRLTDGVYGIVNPRLRKGAAV